MTASPEQQKKGQTLFMTGLAMVMGGCIFGGGLALVFFFLGQRPAAIASGVVAAGVIVLGIVLQARGAKLLRSKAP